MVRAQKRIKDDDAATTISLFVCVSVCGAGNITDTDTHRRKEREREKERGTEQKRSVNIIQVLRPGAIAARTQPRLKFST